MKNVVYEESTATHDHESTHELLRQSEAKRMVALQSEANVYRHKCNLKKPIN